MKAEVRAAYRATVADYTAARQRGDLTAAFAALERAHVLAQRYLIAHTVTHWRMLSVGWALRDRREVLGQLLRLVATVVGYVTGWIPRGNTGGANVSPLQPMPMTGDLEVLMRDYNVWRDVAWRAAMAIALVVVGWTVSVTRDQQADGAMTPSAETDSRTSSPTAPA